MSEPEELRRALREPHDEARAHRNWAAIERRRHRTPEVPSGRQAWLALGLVAAAAMVALGVLAWRGAPGPLRDPSGVAASGVLSGDAVALDDGSVVSLAPSARLEVLENAGDHVRFWLHEGAAHFDVVPGGPRRWAIETGLVTVEVLGTEFTVTRDRETVRVDVQRGSVLVRGPTAPDGMRRLHAGESLEVPAGEPIASAEPEQAAPPITPEVAPPIEPTTEAAPAIATTRPMREPRPEVAPAGEDEHATEASELAAEEAALPSAPRLHDVDVLRAEGRIDEAVTLLETIERDPSAGRERPLAAFTRGRLELDRRQRPREAASAFERAISLGLREPLLEDARARRVEALAQAGDQDAARRAADAYRDHHPNGRWRADVERWSDAP